MFKASMADKVQRIFGIEKVTFDLPSEEREQEAIFIKIDRVQSKIVKGKATARVTGSLAIFANSKKMPFGYMEKRIQAATKEDTVDFFFYNLEQNERYFGNLVERDCNFVYFYSGQYDPAAGSLTSLLTSFTED